MLGQHLPEDGLARAAELPLAPRVDVEHDEHCAGDEAPEAAEKPEKRDQFPWTEGVFDQFVVEDRADLDGADDHGAIRWGLA